MEVSDTAMTGNKEDRISSDENEVLDQSWKKVPHGRPKSGRLWKDPKPVRFKISDLGNNVHGKNGHGKMPTVKMSTRKIYLM